MEENERQNIANVVEAFGKINQDIHDAFIIMSTFLEKHNSFKTWKKKEDGNKGARNGYYDFDTLPTGGGNWYYLNYYGEYKGKVVGFTFVIGVEYDEEDDKYKELIETLGKNINPNAPMLLICGIYETAGDISKSMIVNKNEYNYVDEVLHVTTGWKNFDKKSVSLNKWIDIEIEYEDEDENYLEDMGWYKSAKVKIMHITDAESEEKAENIIKDLIDEANDTPSFKKDK